MIVHYSGKQDSGALAGWSGIWGAGFDAGKTTGFLYNQVLPGKQYITSNGHPLCSTVSMLYSVLQPTLRKGDAWHQMWSLLWLMRCQSLWPCECVHPLLAQLLCVI